MKIETIVNGYLEENCYVIHNDKYALIVDSSKVYSPAFS